MPPLKISAISYLNTVPFVYGIKNFPGFSDYSLEFDVPSSCAEKLISNKTDLGIVPVATIPLIPNARIITNYCIGAISEVKTVVLAAHKPIEELSVLYLDPDSRTSVQLSKVLARHYWKKEFEYLPLGAEQAGKLKNHEGLVLIGDKTFGLNNKYQYLTDLASEWHAFTGLPFVFACWVTNKEINKDLLEGFNEALNYGLINIDKAILDIDVARYPGVDIRQYLTKTISYSLDAEKRKGMELFTELCKTT